MIHILYPIPKQVDILRYVHIFNCHSHPFSSIMFLTARCLSLLSFIAFFAAFEAFIRIPSGQGYGELTRTRQLPDTVVNIKITMKNCQNKFAF